MTQTKNIRCSQWTAERRVTKNYETTSGPHFTFCFWS